MPFCTLGRVAYEAPLHINSESGGVGRDGYLEIIYCREDRSELSVHHIIWELVFPAGVPAACSCSNSYHPLVPIKPLLHVPDTVF
jgi:hypothetical protein